MTKFILIKYYHTFFNQFKIVIYNNKNISKIILLTKKNNNKKKKN